MSVVRARRLKAQAVRLRRIADELHAEALRLETDAAGVPLLRGRAMVDVAVDVLAGRADGMPYRELLDRIEEASGMRVAGEKPAATLLAALNRDHRVMPVGASRSGRYALAEQETGRG